MFIPLRSELLVTVAKASPCQMHPPANSNQLPSPKSEALNGRNGIPEALKDMQALLSLELSAAVNKTFAR